MIARRNGVKRSATVLPTGAGKTVTMGGLVAEHRRARELAGQSGRTSLVIAHRIELVEQNAAGIRAVAPHLRTTVVQADRRNVSGQVISASVQTLGAWLKSGQISRITDVGLVIVDEAHHAAADGYMRILDHFGCLDGARDVWAHGYTATMVRGDAKALGDVWQDITYKRSIAEMIREGWLVRPRGLRVRVPDLNLRGVRRSGGDFNDKALGDAIEGSLAPELVAKAYAEHAPARQGILFAPTVHTAELYRDALREVGITAECVSYLTPASERKRLLGPGGSYRTGRVQVLCNAMVLTEGTDLPMAEVCVIGRPTLNPGLLIQMAGRVLRQSPETGKADALIIDVSGATERHSLLGAIELFGDEGVEVPVELDEADEPGEDVELGLDGLKTDLDEALDEGPAWLTGDVEAVEVDLFHSSKSAWNRTYGGVWFLAATSGEGRSTWTRYIVVMPGTTAGTWDVAEMDKATVGRSSWVVQGVENLSYAMAYGEGNVAVGEAWAARKAARWRGKPVSDAQRRMAQRYRIELGGVATSGEASNLIDQAIASARIDPFVPAYARKGVR